MTTATAPTAPTVSTATPKEMPPFAYRPPPYTGPARDEVLALRRQYVNPAIFTYYRDPLMIVDGRMQYVFDETGRRYLDMFAGIVTVSCGHCHPKITQRLQEQLAKLQHTTTIYLHPNLPRLAEKLASKMPAGLDVTYFVNSGSEANELAVTLSRLYTGHSDVIALRNAYHGATAGAMGLTSHSKWKYPTLYGTNVHHAMCPDSYRTPYSGSPPEIASRSADDIRELIRFSSPGEIAAFIAEPIQGVGGITSAAPNYLREAYEIVREHGGLCIADEVQTGFGRTGEHFWGFENFGVVPDIVTMAKGFGNGTPLAAVTTRREIAEVLTQRTSLNTFGGNPISMAAGLAVIEVIEEDALQENARVVGAHLLRNLRQLQDRHSLVGDVRGLGLMLGVELVRDRDSKTPARAETEQVVEEARALGVLLGRGGFDGNVLRIQPPLCITVDDAEFAVDVLDRALTRTEQAGG